MFKIMLIKMLARSKGRVDELRNFNKEKYETKEEDVETLSNLEDG